MFKSGILSFPNYRRLYFAGLTSDLGSFITDAAIMLFLFNISNDDKSFMGINRAIFLFSLTLGSLLGGIVGERYNRKSVLIFCEAIRVPIIASLFFVSTPWLLIAANASIAFFTGIFKPSRQAIVNDIVPAEKIKSANSLFGTTYAIVHMLGPLIGASLYVALKGISEIVIFDLLSYLLGIYLLYKMTYRSPPRKTRPSVGFATELTEGFRFVFKMPELRFILINTSILGFSIGVLIPLLLPFLKEVLGKGDFYYGIIMAAFGLGGVLGAYFTGHISKSISSGKIILACTAAEALFFALWVRITLFEASCVVIFLWGIVVFIRITSQLNYLSETIETSFLTRVHSLMDLSFIVPNVGAGILIGLIGNRVDTLDILNWTSGLFIIIIVLVLLLPQARTLWRSQMKQVYRDPNSYDEV